jgi:hypothetical protein
MPGGSTLQRGNEIFSQVIYLPAVIVPTVAANTAVSQAVTVPGVNVGDLISWNQQGVVAGLAVDNIYVSAANTLSFYWSNTTVGSLGPTTSPFVLEVTRPENASLAGIATLPNGIY